MIANLGYSRLTQRAPGSIRFRSGGKNSSDD